MSNFELNRINNNIKNSLIQQGIIDDTNSEYLHTSPSLILPLSPSFQKTFHFKNPNSSALQNQKVDFFRKELATLRKDLTLNIQQLRQEMNIKSQRNSPYVYNEELSKFRQEHTAMDNDIIMQMQLLWLNIKEIQNNMETLKASCSSITSNGNVVEGKLANLTQKVEIINQKENEMCKSVNELIQNNKVFESNITKMRIKINDHSNNIKEIKNKISSLQKEVHNENNNQLNIKTKLIQQREFSEYKSNVENKLKSMNDNYTTDISLLKKGINDLKENISEFSSKSKMNTNSMNNFIQFKTTIEQLNEQYNKRLTSLEEKSSEVNQKIDLINKYKKNEIKNSQNIYEANLPQINENKQQIQILQQNLQNIKENNEKLRKDVNICREELKTWQNQLMSQMNQKGKCSFEDGTDSMKDSLKKEKKKFSFDDENPLDLHNIGEDKFNIYDNIK